MKKHIGYFIIALLIIIGIVAISVQIKLLPARVNQTLIEQATLDKLMPLLKKFTAYDDNGLIKLIRMGKDNDCGYVVPEKAVQEADVLLGYGVDADNSFEEAFSTKYNRPSYGFDCFVPNFKGKSPLFTFIKECIGPNKSSTDKKFSTFSEHIEHLGLKDKKVFIKMDIEGGEYLAFEDILDAPQNVTGLVFELHVPKNATKAIKLLSNLRKDFVLLHTHIVNFPRKPFQSSAAIGKFGHLIELTYINKNLVKTFEISKNQKYPTALDMPSHPNNKELEFEPLVLD